MSERTQGHVLARVAGWLLTWTVLAGTWLLLVGGMIFAAAFFQNFLGYGTPGELLSAGTMPLSSIAVALEVSGALVLLWGEFFDQALIVRPG